MTPDRKQQLMQQAADELRRSWGEVQSEALQQLAEDLRALVREGELPSAASVMAALEANASDSLFAASQDGAQTVTASSHRAQQADLER
jgi:hypothetical protein